jgi:hypothetical protein
MGEGVGMLFKWVDYKTKTVGENDKPFFDGLTFVHYPAP